MWDFVFKLFGRWMNPKQRAEYEYLRVEHQILRELLATQKAAEKKKGKKAAARLKRRKSADKRKDNKNPSAAKSP